MYVNAFLLGVLATLFVEMAIIIIVCIVAPRMGVKHSKRTREVNLTKNTIRKTEVK